MSKANLPELMLLYLADALTDEEHAVIKERLASGDAEAKDALREARELYAALPVALDPVEPSPGAADNLMRQVEADALRGEAPRKPKRSKPSGTQPSSTPPTKPRVQAPPAPMRIDRQPSWVLPAALAAGCAIAASATVFFLARWDAQQSLSRVTQQATTLQQQLDAQKQHLAEQDQRLAQQQGHIAEQDAALQAQADALEAQRERLAAQADRVADHLNRVAGVERSLATQLAMTEELRSLLVSQRSDLMVLMQREEEIDRVLSLLSAPRLEAYVLAGTPDAPDAAGRMFYDPQTRRLRLTVSGLDTAQPGRTYQAWFVLDDGAGGPVSLGTFNTDANGEAVLETTLNAAPDRITLAAVSVEPLGGVPAPTGAIVIAGGSE